MLDVRLRRWQQHIIHLGGEVGQEYGALLGRVGSLYFKPHVRTAYIELAVPLLRALTQLVFDLRVSRKWFRVWGLGNCP